MKTTIRKIYFNYEKEEKWLNEMSAMGLALSDYSWCRYVFQEAPAGEYIYRIELLRYSASHPESRRYIEFMEENGVEHIATYYRWTYFRKRAADGQFDIYSDMDSKIRHYKRVNFLFTVLGCTNLFTGSINVLLGLWHLNQVYPVNITTGCICILLGLSLVAIGHPFRRKIKKLKAQKSIME